MKYVLVVQLSSTSEVIDSSAGEKWLSWGIFGSNTEKSANVWLLVEFTWGDHQPSWMPWRDSWLSSGGWSLALIRSSWGSRYQDHKKIIIIENSICLYFISTKMVKKKKKWRAPSLNENTVLTKKNEDAVVGYD